MAEYARTEYPRQTAQIFDFARARILDALRDGRKVVVLFDFADVLFSSRAYQERTQFGFRYESWKSWVDEASAEAVPGAVEFYRWCQDQGVATRIISGRKREARAESDEPSVKNLKKIGIDHYDIVWITKEEADDRGVFKRRAREDLRKRGFDFLVNLGSQERDFSEEPNTLHLKLPNPFYRAPSRIRF